jgi:hypothetical protein
MLLKGCKSIKGGSEMDKAIWAFFILLLVLVIGGTWFVNKSCEDSGGHMEGTGEYTTIYIKSGNVLIPQTTEEMECVR